MIIFKIIMVILVYGINISIAGLYIVSFTLHHMIHIVVNTVYGEITVELKLPYLII